MNLPSAPTPDPLPSPEPPFAAALHAASDKPERFACDAMACTFELYLFDKPAGYAAQAAQVAFDELARLEGLLSRFRPESDIAQINRATRGDLVPIQSETRDCLTRASELYLATGGAFDIAFRSDPAARPRRDTSGVPPLVFDPRAHAVRIQASGLQLDLGALGKGFAIDRLVALLRTWGFARALVQCGQSTVYALGGPSPGRGWRLALRDPAAPDVALGWVPVHDGALAGSGQFLHGAHILDPRNGQPVASHRAAWALAGDAATADALSTACMILSPEDVAAVCSRQPALTVVLRHAPGATTLSAYGASAASFEPATPRG